MAFITLSNHTLASIDANVRSQSGTLSAQESEVFSKQIVDIIHNATLFIRSLLGKHVERDYSTTVAPAEGGLVQLADGHYESYIDLSPYDIFDLNRINLRDKTRGRISLVSEALYTSQITIHDVLGLRRDLFGNVTNLAMGENSKLGIQIYRGKSTGTPGALEMKFPRNPVKAVGPTDKIDILNHHIPLVTDISTVVVFRKIKNVPPAAEIEQRVAASLSIITSQRGVSVTPSTS